MASAAIHSVDGDDGDNNLCSMTIDIELDNDEQQYALSELSERGNETTCTRCCSFETFYDPPPTATEARPIVGNDICIRHLPQLAVRELELYMNPPSYGSMHNWEYMASALGVSNYEIMSLRQSESPTRMVVQRFLNCRLNNLLDVLCELNRIDVLISLQPYTSGLKASNDALCSNGITSDSGAYFDEPGPSDRSLSHRTTTTTFGDVETSPKTSQTNKVNELNTNSKFILITHHEDVTNMKLKKDFKWFMKNLRKSGKQSNIAVYSVEECANESDLWGGLHTTFENALHIVCIFSDDYARMLKSDNEPSSQNIMIKKYVHNLMNSEYVRKNGVNERFRAVLPNGIERTVLPIGWPQNTLVYEFPAHYVQLCKKLFD